MKIIINPGGGLGNLICQFLYGMSLVKKYNCELYFHKNYNYWRGEMNTFKIFNHCNFIDINDTSINDYIKIFEDGNHFHYAESNLDPSNNYIIHGYYQIYKYSNDYIDEFKNILFNNIENDVKIMKEYFNKIKEDKNTCLIHVRRGDYLVYSQTYVTCSDQYYSDAINIINKETKFIIFSDDLLYVKNWEIIKNIDHVIIEETDPINTLILMTLCDNFIIANSSLSLNGYLLRENKNAILISPKKWFGPCGPKYNLDDMIPQNSILINND